MTDNQQVQKELFWRRIPVEGRLAIGLAVFVVGIMCLLFHSVAVFATQADDGKGDVKRGQEVFETRKDPDYVECMARRQPSSPPLLNILRR